MCLRPGPTNIVTLVITKKHGFFSSLPFLKGSVVGYSTLALMVGIGHFELVEEFNQFLRLLTLCGSVYIIIIALCIINSNKIVIFSKNSERAFSGGFLLQWINPYCWISVSEGISKYVNSHESLAVFIAITTFMGLSCQLAWAYIGDKIANIFSSPLEQEIYNVILAGSLAATAIYILKSIV